MENPENKKIELDPASQEMNEMFIDAEVAKEVKEIRHTVELVEKHIKRGTISESTPVGEAMKKLVDFADELVGDEEETAGSKKKRKELLEFDEA